MSFFRRKSLFIILIGLILLVSLIGYSLSNEDNPSKLEVFVSDSIGVLQNVISQPITYVIDFFRNIEDIKNTYDENKVLREKISEYKTIMYDLQQVEKENKELRETLDLIESSRDYNSILATVIARSPEKWIEQVIINRGSQHGIEKNMAVITADGMIGKIKSTSLTTSSVQLISSFDQLHRVSANIVLENGKEIFGLIEGYDSEKEMLIFRIIEDTKEKFKEDERVFSSNLGGHFPSGLLIGTIDEVVPDQYDLTRIAYVKPAANLKDIKEVIVVDRKLDTFSSDEEQQLDLVDEESEAGD